MSHPENRKIAHAEAALMAGKPYENANEGHNQMYDNFAELKAEHERTKNHHSESKQSRGQRIDQELEDEDKQIIAEMDQRKQQSHADSQ